MKFKIIIPTYNSEKWINKCIDSVLNQTYKDFTLVIVDDCSTDNTKKICRDYQRKDKRIVYIELEEKRYNGGTRNVGIQTPILSDYTLFLDNDDWFYNDIVLERINDTIIYNYMPDCVSLSYRFEMGVGGQDVVLERNTPQELVNSLYIAPWTKCIKSSLIQLFPENTLMEDLSQHIKQCDVIESVVSIKEPIVVWNRNNNQAISIRPSEKRKSSEFRQIADVMDLELTHDYCIKQKEYRVKAMLDTILSGKHLW